MMGFKTAGEKIEEPLEPEEQSKLEMRREKQAARSARIIYALQQQVFMLLLMLMNSDPHWLFKLPFIYKLYIVILKVKEIQEDLKTFRNQKMGDTKKVSLLSDLLLCRSHSLTIHSMCR